MEKGCKWHFEANVRHNQGIMDGNGLNFDRSWDGMIRECIQNSLDAVLDTTKPVVVKFSFKHLSVGNFPNFLEIEDHIKACCETYPNAPEYERMREFIGPKEKWMNTGMGYLQISDYNTKGMCYEEDNLLCNFTSFVRSVGTHGGDQNAMGRGGSYGLGKATYFRKSPIRTMLVSTITDQGQYVFEGIIPITTHGLNGVLYSHIGYYDNNNGYPITNKRDIPEAFIRQPSSDGIVASGTDFFLMGRSEQPKDELRMTEAILRNYWLSIMQKKLIVQLEIGRGSVEINAETLSLYLSNSFSNNQDNDEDQASHNPRPYYNAIDAVGASARKVCIDETLPLLGNVKLYLSRDEEATDNYLIFSRCPGMTVMRKRTSSLRLGLPRYGLYGVFMCQNPEGDQLLKKLENASHAEWNKKNWTIPGEEDVDPKALEVEQELKEFLKEKIRAFCETGKTRACKVLGANKYLYLYTDIGSDNKGSVLDNEYQKNIGVRHISPQKPVVIEIPKISKTLDSGTVKNTKGMIGLGAGEQVYGRGPNRGSGNHHPRRPGGNVLSNGSIGDDRSVVTVHRVGYHVYANSENGRIVHHICIKTETDINSAVICFTAKGENGIKDAELAIKDSFGFGAPWGMNLENVVLKAGQNVFKVQFSDNIKHALRIDVNEERN